MENDHKDSQYALLERRARNLPASIEPDHDLWPQIAARLAVGVSRERHKPFRKLAGLGVLAAGLAAAAVLALLDRQQAAPPRSAPATQLASAGSHLGPDFRDARQSLVGGLEAPLQHLPAKARAIIAANLEGVEQSRVALDDALREQPNDPLLQELILSASIEELHLLRELNLLASTVVERTQL